MKAKDLVEDRSNNMQGQTLAEVLECGGPICAHDALVLVTVNGSYVNVWAQNPDGSYTCVDCRSGHLDLYHMTAAEMIDLAEATLKDWLNPMSPEEAIQTIRDAAQLCARARDEGELTVDEIRNEWEDFGQGQVPEAIQTLGADAAFQHWERAYRLAVANG